MSSHAWLDSLSEDWPSQPSSPVHSKPPTLNGPTKSDSTSKTTGTKIPRPRSSQGAQRKFAATPSHSRNGSIVLNERSPSDINIPVPSAKRTPSKLLNELGRDFYRGHRASKSFNESPAGSVIHNTVQHRSLSSSPGKNRGNTPEWKRRLIYGDLAYGEQRDLFTSAATGLEGMFKPPTPVRNSLAQAGSGDDDRVKQTETTMPSSPPDYSQEYSNYETYDDGSSEQQLPGQQPEPSRHKGRSIKYKLNDAGDADISQNSNMSFAQHATRGGAGEANLSLSLPSAPSKASSISDNKMRTISGQSAVQHEDFSPILIAKHSSDDGKIEFAPIKVSPTELQQRLEKLQNDRGMFSGSEDGNSQAGAGSYDTEATESIKQLGSYVNTRRGVSSADDSFRHHRLASGIGNTSDMLPEESLQASTPKQFPSVRIHEPRDMNSTPKTPPHPQIPSPHKNALQNPGNGASPLKLFGPYDTFTNQTLLRRISQFEDPNSSRNSARLSDEQREIVDSLRHVVKVASLASSGSKKSTKHAEESHPQSHRSFSQFGAGELDGYAFKEGFSSLSNESGDESVLHHSVSVHSVKKSPYTPAENIVIGKRRPKPDSTSSAHTRTLSRDSARAAPGEAVLLATPRHHELVAEYKRARGSPYKDRTPKRRRTLHESDIAFGIEEAKLCSSSPSQQQMRLSNGKRKITRPENLRQIAEPIILASPQIIHSRTPTLGQRSSLSKEISSLPDDDVFQDDAGVRPQAVLPRPNHPNLPLDRERKPSIRTEDFLNEAHRIMAAIRGKNGPQSGLTSVEESDEDLSRNPIKPNVDDVSFQESTRERFSRPPSREGKPVPRVAKRQEDPELASRLKKYEEHSEMGDIIASSLRSLGVSKEDIKAVQALEQGPRDSGSDRSGFGILDNNEIVSDPANVRISENPYLYEHSTAAEEAQHFRVLFRSHSSSSESGSSTSRSARTASSRNSENRKTIAPESVIHLIPDQVGNMVLDKQRNVWVKSRRTHATRTRRSNTLTSENSEDDPFADIPDLTVDVSRELQNLRLREARLNAARAQTESNSNAQTKSSQGGTLRSILVKDFAEAPGRTESVSSSHKLMKQFVETEDEKVEHEITIDEDRMDENSPKRRMTISFSSPIASVIQDFVAGGSSEEPDASAFDQSTASLPRPPERHGLRSVSIQSISSQAISRSRNSFNATSRRLPIKGEAFVPRPATIIEEQDEASQNGKSGIAQELGVLQDQSLSEYRHPRSRQTSLNILLSTPALRKPHPNPQNAEVLGQYVGNMSLSPLPDFTAHPERSYAFEISYVLGDQNLVTGDGTRQHLSQAVRQLVDKIAEVEPFEPFWEEMKEIDLRDKRLSSLHMLDRFCGRLLRLNVSRNLIGALDGIPSTIRELTVSHNLLSDLTAFDRLNNLQYVDVSNNNIKSLSVFRGLVHLRDLVADNTGLVDLNGIKYHESLLTLRARGNDIEELDFDGTSLQKLQRLDLEGNKLRKIENLHELSSLLYLSLKGNRLTEFHVNESLDLKHLILSKNKLRSLDVTMLTGLHLLYADCNKLTTVLGLRRVPHLDSLSLREQGGSKTFDLSFLATAYEVRKLFLSGTPLGAFAPPRDFLNLQLLELANCGLQRLPDKLGEMMPNLRVLNLNFNGLSNISSLHCIPRLKRLHLAGNRFSDLKGIVRILAKLPWLTEVDLRDTPLTQGFYPPVHVILKKDDEEQEPAVDPFKLPDADLERDAKFCGCLDMDTKIERRVHERKIAKMCKQLQRLDGLPVNRRVRVVKDLVWKAMVERGLVLKPDGKPFDLSKVELEDEELSSIMSSVEPAGYIKARRKGPGDRWGAEDSLA